MIFKIKIFLALLISLSRACPTIRTLTGHKDSISSLIMLKDGNIASSSLDSTILIWNPSTGKLVQNISTKQPVNQLVELKNGNLASLMDKGEITTWDPSNGKLLKTFNKKESPLLQKLLPLDDGNLASIISQNSIKIWNPNTGLVTKVINDSVINKLFVLNNNNLAAVVFPDWKNYKINIWNSQNGVLVKKLAENGIQKINDLKFLKQGYLAVACEDHSVKIWNYNTSKLVFNLTGHSNGVSKLEIIDDERIVSASYDGTGKIWNYLNGSLLRTISGEGYLQNVLSINKDYLVTVFQDYVLRVWNLNTGEMKAKIDKIYPLQLINIKNNSIALTLNWDKNRAVYVYDFNNESCLETSDLKAKIYQSFLKNSKEIFEFAYQKIWDQLKSNSTAS